MMALTKLREKKEAKLGNFSIFGPLSSTFFNEINSNKKKIRCLMRFINTFFVVVESDEYSIFNIRQTFHMTDTPVSI